MFKTVFHTRPYGITLHQFRSFKCLFKSALTTAIRFGRCPSISWFAGSSLPQFYSSNGIINCNGLQIVIVCPLFSRLTFSSSPHTKESFPIISFSIRPLRHRILGLQPLRYSRCWIFYFSITDVHKYELYIRDRIVSCNVEVTFGFFLYITCYYAWLNLLLLSRYSH